MKECLGLRGIVTVLNTPFGVDGQVDPAALRTNVRRAIDAGVAGFLVPAMAGEVDKLTPGERELLVETVLDEARGRVPVIGGASAASPAERARLARWLVAHGCEGVLVSIRYEDDDQYARAVHEVADVAPAFLMLQDWDERGYGVPPATLVQLFETIETLRAVKVEVAAAGRKYTELLNATGGRLHVSGGWAVMQMIDALDRGVHAFMPTAMHTLYVRIYRLYAQGNRPAARKLFEKILPVVTFSNQNLDISIHFFKRLLYAQGVYPTPLVREPILPFDEMQSRAAQELIDRVCALEAEIAGQPLSNAAEVA